MMSEVSVEEFNEWIAMFYRIGLDEEGWSQAGMVAAATHNAAYETRCTLASATPKDDGYASPKDFYPFTDDKPKGDDSIEAFRRRIMGQ